MNSTDKAATIVVSIAFVCFCIGFSFYSYFEYKKEVEIKQREFEIEQIKSLNQMFQPLIDEKEKSSSHDLPEFLSSTYFQEWFV